MTFDPVTFQELTVPDGMSLFVAWNPHGAEPSDTVHRSLRRRFDAGDPQVQLAMRDLAVQAARARRAIEVGDGLLLAEAMDRSFDIRASIVEVDSTQQVLIDLGRSQRAAVLQTPRAAAGSRTTPARRQAAARHEGSGRRRDASRM